ncbi:MAG: YIP1 family protein [Acidobacteriota bacterium]
MPRRILGASLLRSSVYEEVEADPAATAQAALVVVASSVAGGIGATGFTSHGVATAAFFTVVGLVFWVAWALVTLVIGVRLLPKRETRSDMGEMLRTLGFATAPGLLRPAGLVPGLAVPVLALTTVWMLAAMLVAVRHALDYSSIGRAVAVCLIGWLFAIGFVLLFGVLFGPTLS